MECRESQTLLTAFHDGELPAADRSRVEEHLRGCADCTALLADLARVDRAAGVPDPGPAYWERFNARVMDRVEREADGPGVRVLRPKNGWMREQLRYLVPAAAAAALVLVIVHYAGMRPGAPTPAAPPAVNEPAPQDSAGERRTEAAPEPRATKQSEDAVVARRVPPPVPAKEQFAAVTREERDSLADRPLSSGDGEASRDRAAAPAAVNVPSPSPVPYRGTPAGSPPVTAENGMTQGMQAERKKMEGAAAPMAEPQGGGKAAPASGTRVAKETAPGSPCELARTLAERERIRDAEVAQRACLAQDRSAVAQEKGLVFLAELLDRQERFAEADAVIADVDRQFPQSRPLDLYRQQRPMVQKQPGAVPVTR